MSTNLNLLRKRIEQTSSLPTLPTVMTTILNLLENIESNIEDINNAITQDMVISSKVLKLANSAFYGFSRKIETISDAVVLLGFNTVSSLAISVSVFSNFFVQKNPSFDLKKFWQHCIGTAVIAKLIGRTIKYHHLEPLFVSGILHDIGKIILYQNFSNLFAEALKDAEHKQEPLYLMEEDIIGADHSVIGDWLSDRWKFPELTKQIIAYHHRLEFKHPDDKMNRGVKIISLANYLANKREVGFGGDKYPDPELGILLDTLGMTESFLDAIISRIPGEIKKSKIFFAVAD